MNTLYNLLSEANLPKNEIIRNNFIKAYKIINDPKYNNVMCSISGGSDSDIMLDILYKVDVDKKIKYVWFDTGLEYEATKRHLDDLENRYGIKIQKERAIKPIPISCKEYGQPFLSKLVSTYISKLQRVGFKFDDEPFDLLVERYPGCKESLSWWTNRYIPKNGKPGSFTIARHNYLKEFLIENPPKFKISSECCKYAKKDVSNMLIDKYNVDLMCVGMRKAEGGQRSFAFDSCFSEELHGAAQYRPLWWYTNNEKYIYIINIVE